MTWWNELTWRKIRQPPTYWTFCSFLLSSHWHKSSTTTAPQANPETSPKSPRNRKNRESTFPSFEARNVPIVYSKKLRTKSSLTASPIESSLFSRKLIATFLFNFVAPYDSSKSENGSCSVKLTGLPVTGRPRISAASSSVIRISPPERSTNARLPQLHASISSVRNTLFRQWFGTDRRFPKPVREIAALCSAVRSCTRFAYDLSENRVLKGFVWKCARNGT